jgi:hypothetical protein
MRTLAESSSHPHPPGFCTPGRSLLPSFPSVQKFRSNRNRQPVLPHLLRELTAMNRDVRDQNPFAVRMRPAPGKSDSFSSLQESTLNIPPRVLRSTRPLFMSLSQRDKITQPRVIFRKTAKRRKLPWVAQQKSSNPETVAEFWPRCSPLPTHHPTVEASSFSSRLRCVFHLPALFAQRLGPPRHCKTPVFHAR